MIGTKKKKLARGKAEELENFGAEKKEADSVEESKGRAGKREIEEGTRLVSEMLWAWMEAEKSRKSSTEERMDVDDDPTVQLEAKLASLKHSFQSFLPQLEQNPWVRDVLMNSY